MALWQPEVLASACCDLRAFRTLGRMTGLDLTDRVAGFTGLAQVSMEK